MKYLLDSNVCIGYLNGTAQGVLAHLRIVPATEIAICSVVKAELSYGANRSVRPAQTLAHQRQFLDQFVSLLFDDSAAEVYGRLRAQLAAAGAPIGPNDLMIAAIAVANDLVLVTHNTREFSRVPGLTTDDWQA